jgi:hypothetical protein
MDGLPKDWNAVQTAIDNGTVAGWNLPQLEAGLALMHAANVSHHLSGTILNNCETLRARIQALRAEADKQQILAQAAENSTKLISELGKHHKTHRRTLRWATVGGLTGLIIAGAEIYKFVSRKYADQSPPPTVMQPISASHVTNDAQANPIPALPARKSTAPPTGSNQVPKTNSPSTASPVKNP